MLFYSESNKPTRVAMPKCPKYQPEYEEFIDPKTGNEYLKETGKTNTYERIQEAKDGALLKNIIERYNFKIDETRLDKIENTINDFTGIPDNIIESLNIVNQARTTFDEMPKDIKNMFNNNFNEFLIGAQNGTLKSILDKKTGNKQVVNVIPNQGIDILGGNSTLEDEIQKAKDKLEQLQQKSMEDVKNG